MTPIQQQFSMPGGDPTAATPTDRVGNSESGFVDPPLTLTQAPPVAAPADCTAAPLGATSWAVYTRANPREPLTAAFTDSLVRFAMTRNRVPKLVLLNFADYDTLSGPAHAADLLVTLRTSGSATVQPGTWGLA